MQPTYLPWCGYFALMDAVDVFVLLDTVDISRQSWQTRNRIQARDGKVVLLSVPVHAKLGQRLDTVQIAHQKWQKKHWATIEAAYKKSPGWPSLRGALIWGYTLEWVGLSNLTGHLIRRLAYILGINTQIVRASDLGETRDDKHGRIVDLCRAVDATTYVSTTGASYLDETEMENISLEWFHYDHPTYDQGTAGFTPYLSVLDCVAHCGDQAIATIRNGFYATGCEASAKSATESR